MDRELWLLGLGAAAVAVFLLAPASPLAKQANAVAEGWAGTTWSPYKPRVAYYCRGGLYHPAVAGEGRNGLLAHGWAWISDPPSELGPGPGVDGG
jgi:hypothetical protein